MRIWLTNGCSGIHEPNWDGSANWLILFTARIWIVYHKKLHHMNAKWISNALRLKETNNIHKCIPCKISLCAHARIKVYLCKRVHRLHPFTCLNDRLACAWCENLCNDTQFISFTAFPFSYWSNWIYTDHNEVTNSMRIQSQSSQRYKTTTVNYHNFDDKFQ